jgi:hypothetical protein
MGREELPGDNRSVSLPQSQHKTGPAWDLVLLLLDSKKLEGNCLRDPLLVRSRTRTWLESCCVTPGSFLTSLNSFSRNKVRKIKLNFQVFWEI